MNITLNPRDVLKETFGYSCFRGHQEAIIDCMLEGGDAFVLMPTGAGKSLCYQIPSIIRPGVGVVISPLIALMQDQVQAMQQIGVRADFLNSTLDRNEAAFIEEQIRNDALDLLYIAPERLLTERTLNLLDQCRLALFAIDEAHCVSHWGHDFREEYLRLSILHRRFPGIPKIALTATADGPTRNEIIERLNLDTARTYISGFDRPNIRYCIVHKDNPRRQLLNFLDTRHPRGAGIVYCLSRKKSEDTAAWLNEQGRNALPYHAGLDSRLRKLHQDRFLREDDIIIVATIAFGMGIDKPDVRFVAHLDLPKSIEAYYQETGRAGRDGLPADAFMTYGLSDVVMLKHFIESSDADEFHKSLEHRKLNALLGLCETTECRRKVLLNYFGENVTGQCGNCDTCLNPVQSVDGTLTAKKALFCIYQTGQRFGTSYLADVLTGKQNDRITQFGHDTLSAFGGGRELGTNEWKSVFRQLTAMGLLTVDMEHGSLKLTARSKSVMKGEQEVSLRKDPKPERKSKKNNGKKSKITEAASPEENQLFENLRQLRLEIARENNLPAYMIFHDSALMDMASLCPSSLEEFSKISGVGRRKLERYGSIFIKKIQDFQNI